MKAHEVNFDGLIGPTHYFGGLSAGNFASTKNQRKISYPKLAALEGLEKMKLVMDLGVPQGVLPPQSRPSIRALKQLGFYGTDESIIEQASKIAPNVFHACCNASSMWTANAATISPSIDSEDNLVHFTAANLNTFLHRSIEKDVTSQVLKKIFSSKKHFVHHEPLLASNETADEGAANHIRLCSSHAEKGLQLFVYGREALHKGSDILKYPARQTREASEAISRLHLIPADRAIFAKQNPKAISQGVFHNDLISTGNENLFLYHEDAFENSDLLLETLHRKMESVCNTAMIAIKVPRKLLSIKEAVKSYLFNSQIVSCSNGSVAVIAPIECKQNVEINAFLKALVQEKTNPISKLHFVTLSESMKNGGGPACLRLRVVLTEKELASLNANVLLTNELYDTLKLWIKKHYRDELKLSDLKDPCLYRESQNALLELTKILKLEGIYDS